MNFNSFLYIFLFLPLVVLLCRLARSLQIAKAPQLIVLLASLTFYAWSKPSNLFYLIGSILANWGMARLITNAPPERRKLYLQFGLVVNVAFLCTFKYLNFFISNIPYFAHHNLYIPDLGFPLGISFFTLAQIMYLVDCYEELITPGSLFDHATFVSFFPYVISGPISRSKRILHQFPALNGAVDAETTGRAIYLFSMGLFKKVVFADAFSKIADFGFSNIANLSTFNAWCTVSAYALQIYFDFSGYSDMAIASALFLGIEVPRNFDAPLRAKSVIEYWQRWHITLTSFITTYLYTPILQSFNRATLATSAIATLLAMTIAGLWHGPAWTFVVFGVIHGVGLAVNQYWRKKKMPALPKPIGWLLTFFVFEMAFVFFRAPDLPTAGLFLTHMFGLQHGPSTVDLNDVDGAGLIKWIFVAAQTGGVLAAFLGKSTTELAQNFKATWPTYAYTVACSLIAFLYLNSNVAKPFVYFAF